MSGMLSFRNEFAQRSVESGASFSLLNGTTIDSGSVNSLLTRQLSKGIVLGGGNINGKWFRVGITLPQWGSYTPSVGDTYLSRAGVRVFALLGLNLPVFKNTSPPPQLPYLRIFGVSWDPVSMVEQLVLLKEDNPYRNVTIEGESGPVNRIYTGFEYSNPVTGEGLEFAYYVVNISLDEGNGTNRAPFIGGIWIGNAVVLPFANNWELGVIEQGADIAISRGGQAYANKGSICKTLSGEFTGTQYDRNAAFGKNVVIPYTGIRRTPDWMQDAQIHIGRTGPCIVVPRAAGQDGSGVAWTQDPYTAVYGSLNSPIRIIQQGGDIFSTPVQITEER